MVRLRMQVRVGGSPFKTFAEAENACEAMLVTPDQIASDLAYPQPRREPAGFDFVGNRTSGRIERHAASAEKSRSGEMRSDSSLAGCWCGGT